MKKVFSFVFLSFYLLTSAFDTISVNHTDSNTYSVSSDNLTWTNLSNPQIVENDSVVELYPRVLPYEGKLSVGMSFKSGQKVGTNQEISRRCTSGFAVKRLGLGRFDHGYLTVGGCSIKKREEIPHNGFSAYFGGLPNRVGVIKKGDLFYSPEQGINAVAIKILADYWDPIRSTQVSVAVESGEEEESSLELVDVRDAAVAKVGDRVCFYSEYSEFNCGEVKVVGSSGEALAPWKSTFELPFGLKVSYYPLEYYRNLVHVELDFYPKALSDRVASYDSGAPVFIPVLDENGRIIAVHPVGILVLYETLSLTPRMDYMLLDSLLRESGLTLLTTPQHN